GPNSLSADERESAISQVLPMELKVKTELAHACLCLGRLAEYEDNDSEATNWLRKCIDLLEPLAKARKITPKSKEMYWLETAQVMQSKGSQPDTATTSN